MNAYITKERKKVCSELLDSILLLHGVIIMLSFIFCSCEPHLCMIT